MRSTTKLVWLVSFYAAFSCVQVKLLDWPRYRLAFCNVDPFSESACFLFSLQWNRWIFLLDGTVVLFYVAGPYMLLTGGFLFILSKELMVWDHALMETFFGVASVTLLCKYLGKKVNDYSDKYVWVSARKQPTLISLCKLGRETFGWFQFFVKIGWRNFWFSFLSEGTGNPARPSAAASRDNLLELCTCVVDPLTPEPPDLGRPTPPGPHVIRWVSVSSSWWSLWPSFPKVANSSNQQLVSRFGETSFCDWWKFNLKLRTVDFWPWRICLQDMMEKYWYEPIREEIENSQDFIVEAEKCLTTLEGQHHLFQAKRVGLMCDDKITETEKRAK